jgi:hypothetical protein
MTVCALSMQDRRKIVLKRMSDSAALPLQHAAKIADELERVPKGFFRGPVFGPIIAEV